MLYSLAQYSDISYKSFIFKSILYKLVALVDLNMHLDEYTNLVIYLMGLPICSKRLWKGQWKMIFVGKRMYCIYPIEFQSL